MKTHSKSKSTLNASNLSALRVGGISSQAARTLERRYERRKIREQLRRLDWALNID